MRLHHATKLEAARNTEPPTTKIFSVGVSCEATLAGREPYAGGELTADDPRV
jgi:hypothetical protein